jgi:hypothetical protein
MENANCKMPNANCDCANLAKRRGVRQCSGALEHFKDETAK